MGTFWTIFIALSVGIAIIYGITKDMMEKAEEQKLKSKEYRPYRETPDDVLKSEYKKCLKELAVLGTKNISSWLEQQTVQSSVNRIEASLTLYAKELEARGYKIDYSDYKNVKFQK